MTDRGSRHGSPAAAVAARWVGWVAVAAAVLCLLQAGVAVNRGRVVRADAAATVVDLQRSNALFAGVNLGAAQQIQNQLDSLATTVGQLPAATGHLVDLLAATTAEVHGIAAAGAGNASIATALEAATAALARQLVALRETALGGAAGAADTVGLLDQTDQLVASLNRELAAIQQKLRILP